MDRIKELQEELTIVFSGRNIKLFDSIIPLIIFLVTNSLIGLELALWAALGAAFGFTVVRIFQKENLRYSLGGLGGVLLAGGIVVLSGSESGFFLPGLLSGGIIVLVSIMSILIQRPLAAWTSYLTRRWPLAWYWHSKVKPAYMEVTLIWAVAFAARLGVEYWLFQQGAVQSLGYTRLLLGWPYTILLLIISYLYGIWRLGVLKGPSVEEFKAGLQPPWAGQRRGF